MVAAGLGMVALGLDLGWRLKDLQGGGTNGRAPLLARVPGRSTSLGRWRRVDAVLIVQVIPPRRPGSERAALARAGYPTLPESGTLPMFVEEAGLSYEGSDNLCGD
jgi:hypothetical protein